MTGMKLKELYERLDGVTGIDELTTIFLTYIEQFGADYFTAFTIGIKGNGMHASPMAVTSIPGRCTM